MRVSFSACNCAAVVVVIRPIGPSFVFLTVSWPPAGLRHGCLIRYVTLAEQHPNQIAGQPPTSPPLRG